MRYTLIEITYLDGTVEDVQGDQRDAREFDFWANRRGLIPPPGRDLGDSMPTVFLRVCAWSAHQRATGKKRDFDEWDATVQFVKNKGLKDVDPTQPAAPDDSSTSSPPELE